MHINDILGPANSKVEVTKTKDATVDLSELYGPSNAETDGDVVTLDLARFSPVKVFARKPK